MEGSDILIMVFSMVTSALLGAFGMLLFGGKTALNYLRVKAMRGRGVLLMAKTKFGWRSFVAKKKENTLKWRYDGKKVVTNIDDGDLTRYMRIDMIFVDADLPARAIRLKDGSLYPDDFDPETFNNILVRALTRPNADGSDDLKKLLTILLILGVITVFALLMIYFKLGDLAPQVAAAVI
jgi:flagellar basal body-associated protein FliL